MVEVTQADREAAAAITVLPEMRELILSGRADHHAEPFARHRQTAADYWYRQGKDDGHEAAVQAIVRWLREQYSGRLQSPIFLADATEAGEPFK